MWCARTVPTGYTRPAGLRAARGAGCLVHKGRQVPVQQFHITQVEFDQSAQVGCAIDIDVPAAQADNVIRDMGDLARHADDDIVVQVNRQIDGATTLQRPVRWQNDQCAIE